MVPDIRDEWRPLPSIYSLEHERVQVAPSIGYGSELSKTGSMRRPRPRNCQTPSGEVGKPARLFGSPEIMGAAATGRGNNTPLFRFIHTKKDFLLLWPLFALPNVFHSRSSSGDPKSYPRSRHPSSAVQRYSVRRQTNHATFHLIACQSFTSSS